MRFAVAFSAEFEECPFTIVEVMHGCSEQEVQTLGLKKCYQSWPVDLGYHDHRISLTEIKPDEYATVPLAPDPVFTTLSKGAVRATLQSLADKYAEYVLVCRNNGHTAVDAQSSVYHVLSAYRAECQRNAVVEVADSLGIILEEKKK